MISSYEEIEGLWKEIDKALNSKVSVYLIGGAALMYNKLKIATKDIDIIVDDNYELVKTAIENLNFKEKDSDYERLKITKILKRNDFQIDLFNKTVVDKLSLSKGMKERATNIYKGKNLQVFLCSKEDILLFKSVTLRAGDKEDCTTLAKEEINWKAILEEITNQIKLSGEQVWITYLGERLDELEKEGITTPIIKEVHKEVIKYYEEFEKRKK